MTDALRSPASIHKDATAILESAVTAVQTRNVRALRSLQGRLADLLAGQQLLRIALYYEREHGLRVEKKEVA